MKVSTRGDYAARALLSLALRGSDRPTSVKEIAVPVAVWQGTEDMMVPFAHAEWLAANIPGVHAHFAQGEGHISLFASMPTILDDLLEIAGLR